MDYGTGFTTISQKYIVVSIMACSEAKLGLAWFPRTIVSNMYEVVIGSNSNRRIEVRSAGETVASYDSPDDLLDCSQYK